jgi:hypothetical protein
MGILFSSSRNQPANAQTTTQGDKKSDDSNPDEGWRHWVMHDAAGFFTLWLVIVGAFQVGLFVWQLWLIRKSLGEAKFAAEAAKIAADAAKETAGTSRAEFAATHRPKIRFKHLWFLSNVWQGEQIFLELIYVNNGPTKAVIPWVNFKTVIIPAGKRLPQRPPFNPVPLVQLPTPQILTSGQTGTLPGITDGRTLTADEITAIRKGRSRLYFIGTIGYYSMIEPENKMDQPRIGEHLRQTAFARYIKFSILPAHADDAGRFEKECDPDYEYED